MSKVVFGTYTMIVTMKIRPLGNRSYFDPVDEHILWDRLNWNPLGSGIVIVIVVLSGYIKYSVFGEQ